MKTAVVIGATGLIGTELIHKLEQNQNYDKVIILARREVKLDSKKIENTVISFEEIEQQQFPPGADFFCALGTTIKQVGSQAEFRKVDYDYVFQFAKVAKKCSANSFHLVSALGANPHSANFYSKTKGQVEKAISNLGLNKFRIYRPSLLIGQRDKLGQPIRLGEEIFAAIFKKAKFLFIGFLKQYEPITAVKVAEAMLKNAVVDSKEKKEIILNQDMH